MTLSRCLKRALNGLRDASRPFHEHFAAVLTSRLGFTQSEAQPTVFVDLARNVFIAVHVDDAHSCLKYVGEMKQYFTVKVSHPLSASSTQTYVGAQYLRHGDAIWELPTARYVTGMLNGHGMQNAEPVVTLVVNCNDDDDESEEASAEEHRSLRRIHCGQETVSWHRDAQTLLFLRAVWRGLWHVLQNRTPLRRSVSCDVCEVRRMLDRSCKCKTERAQL